MVRDPAEREKRTEKEGKGTNVEGIKRERGEEGEECGEREEVEEGRVAFLHFPTPPHPHPRVSGWGEGQRRGKQEVEAGGEERGEGWREGEGPVWLLSASHVSKPVLKNE